jgi:hypothetical protein
MDITKVVALSLGFSILGGVLWLIRERRIKEKYALLWLITSLIIIILASSRKLLEVIATAVGIYYPPSLLFLLATIFLVIVNISFSISLSRLTDSNRLLAQEVALLKKKVTDSEPEQSEKQ